MAKREITLLEAPSNLGLTPPEKDAPSTIQTWIRMAPQPSGSSPAVAQPSPKPAVPILESKSA